MGINEESVLFVSIKKVIDGRESLIVLGGEELCSLFEQVQHQYDVQDVMNEAEVVGFPLRDYGWQEIEKIAKLYRERLDNSDHWPAVARSAIRDVLNVQI